MEIKASLKNFRTSPRKMRLVANLVSGLEVGRAELELARLPKHAAAPLLKLLRSAEANARNNFKQDAQDLYIKKLLVNSGTVLKRFMPRAFGRAAMIRKKSCHVDLVLGVRNQVNGEERRSSSGTTAIAEETETRESKNNTQKPTKRRDLETVKRVGKIEKKGFAQKIFSRKVV